ncbi:hypothetical protein Sango_2720600 [Sesamum angolense]|uniref:Integrase catalytic domain-containing protein n=1 Tax=Sesamum angolense TaxID=2727404 RepID=A0AAE1W3A5_9LAMI|nr:hypothetical protein Sango_2720600 [Sesamum angolense]
MPMDWFSMRAASSGACTSLGGLEHGFITHIPSSNGHTVIWVVIDRLTKYAHFVGLSANVTAPSLAATFAVEIYRLHGMPKSIVSDRDPLFLSRFWSELFRLSGTKLAYNSAYHPQSDGQTEPPLVYRHNTLPSLLWPPTAFNLFLYFWNTSVTALDESLRRRHSILSMARYHLARARLRMKQQAHRHRLAPASFDLFALFAASVPWPTSYLYRQDPRIHPVFHASLLKPFHGDPSIVPIVEPPESTDLVPPLIPSAILGHRTINTTDGTLSQVLVHWANQSEAEASWVSIDDFVASCPNFDLEGKVVVGAPSTDTTQIPNGLHSRAEAQEKKTIEPTQGLITSGLTEEKRSEGPI